MTNIEKEIDRVHALVGFAEAAELEAQHFVPAGLKPSLEFVINDLRARIAHLEDRVTQVEKGVGEAQRDSFSLRQYGS